MLPVRFFQRIRYSCRPFDRSSGIGRRSSPGKASWEEAQNGRDLFAGDSVKTGQDSRAAILCVDETQLKLNENTVVVLKSSAPSARMGIAVPAAQRAAGASLYEVPAGEIWLRNKNEKTRFEVQTPAVTAAIRGTEFNLKVDQSRRDFSRPSGR